MNAMNADRPQWARDDTSQNVNVSFDKNMSSMKLKLKPGHLSPSHKMPQQPPTARSERDPPSMYRYIMKDHLYVSSLIFFLNSAFL